jgi:hypothetical protein
MVMTPIGAIAFAVGLPMMVSIAETVNELSHELAKGDYKLNGMGKWALATTMLYATFTPILLVLGAIGMAASVVKFFTGTDPFETAKGMIINIAETIVSVSYVLKKGTYKGGPSEEWATGIAIALGAFSPVYGMLVRNSAMSFLTGEDGGVGPDDFAKAIMVVSEGIITAAGFFANKNLLLRISFICRNMSNFIYKLTSVFKTTINRSKTNISKSKININKTNINRNKSTVNLKTDFIIKFLYKPI